MTEVVHIDVVPKSFRWSLIAEVVDEGSEFIGLVAVWGLFPAWRVGVVGGWGCWFSPFFFLV